ncbi:NAD(P)-dependent oxidoreductase [Bacillus gobiensis]|uniref:NAD-dependent epimerase/dehydratase family protein n=1 Tax=Bacillus gobiensis TaxID=1441095 RepID=UPI003D21141F
MTENKTTPLTVLVTGATGFVGSHVARRFVERGWSVHILVRPNSSLAPIHSIEQSVTVYEHDGTMEGLFDIVKASKPDIVVHLAAFSFVHYEPKDIEPMIRSNVLFGTHLAEAMVANGVNHLIATGTYSQHYENKPYSPSCLYASTKQAFSDILQYYTEATPLQVITLKLFDNFGPNDPRSKIMNLLHKSAVEQKPLAMSPGEQFIDILYIDDVVDAYEMAVERFVLEHAGKNEVYAVSSENPLRLKELVAVYEKASGNKLQIEWGARPYREREAMVLWNQGELLPGWRAKTSLEEGIQKFINS